MQRYVFLCKNKKPDSNESGCPMSNLQNHYLSFTDGHNFPDSYKVLFIRFFTEIICTKCHHYFIL